MTSVLVVEDEPGIADAIHMILADAGYDVRLAADGAQALAALRARRADVLLVDYMMPVVSGAELVRAVRADPATADVPVVAMSALAEATVRRDLQDYAAFLRKPFGVAALLEALEQAVGHPP